MALTKQPVNIPFQMGLDTKSDPYQIPIGKFLQLNNSIFDTIGRLTKRNGFANLTTNPTNNPLGFSTFKNSLVSAGVGIQSYSPDNGTWTSNGSYQPLNLSVTSLIRNNFNQIQCDVAVASNNLACITYLETKNAQATTVLKYSILDAMTGETVVAPVTIATGAPFFAPRIFLLGTHFIIVFTTVTPDLSYIAIDTTTLSAGAPVTISADYSTTTNPYPDFDGVVASSILYLGWNNAASNKVLSKQLSAALSLSAPFTIDNVRGALTIGMCADTSGGSPVIWFMYQSNGSGEYAAAANSTLSTVTIGPTQFDPSTSQISNITGYATAGTCHIFYEFPGNTGYDTTIQSNSIWYNTVNSGGAGSPALFALETGLASKVFLFNSVPSVFLATQTQYQPSYFLVDATVTSSAPPPNVIAKLAYQNGGGYLTFGLPSVPLNGSFLFFPYLFKDLIAPVNKGTNLSSTATNPVQTAGIYSQTGINLAALNYPSTISATEIGTNLNLSGGFVWSYDGTLATEQNFFLWPELQLNADGTYKGFSKSTASITLHGTPTSGSALLPLTSDPIAAGVVAGMVIAGTGIATGAFVTGFHGSSTIVMSAAATSSPGAEDMTFTGNMDATTYYYVFTYEWTDNQGNALRSAPSIPTKVVAGSSNTKVSIKVPTLPLTYKVSNPVKIVGYRWSLLQQEYFQFTSITIPYQNIFTVNYITLIDGGNDSFILGNSILYTTGGVVEDISPPATSMMALFDTRLWLVDSEDRNLLWHSKQAIEATSLEMSDLLTYYVPPIVGAQGNAGPLTSIFPLDDKLILFRSATMQYINGSGPDNTGANGQYSQPIYISSPVGCSNQQSITVIPNGLIFQSNNGIWLLDHNLQPKYVGAPVQQYNSNLVTSATTIPGTTQVRFTLNSGVILMYDYFVDQWNVFSNVTGVSYAQSATIWNSLHTVVSSSSVASQETAATYLDGANPVLMSFTTGWINVAGLRGYERAYFFFLLGTYLSPHTLTMSIAKNYDSTIIQTSTFTPDSTTNIEDFRFFFDSTTAKCESFQLTITESLPNGASAGAGLTISGLNLIIGAKKGYAPISAAKSIG